MRSCSLNPEFPSLAFPSTDCDWNFKTRPKQPVQHLEYIPRLEHDSDSKDCDGQGCWEEVRVWLNSNNRGENLILYHRLTSRKDKATLQIAGSAWKQRWGRQNCRGRYFPGACRELSRGSYRNVLCTVVWSLPQARASFRSSCVKVGS